MINPQLNDQFAPSKDDDIEFWRIPKTLARSTDFSWGAKMLYGVLYGLAHKYTYAYASYKTLKKYLGEPSESSLNRWIRELRDGRLIRILQRGRGLANYYYLLRSPLLGNMTHEEFADGPKIVYNGTLTEKPVLVSEAEAHDYFDMECFQWAEKSKHPADYPMPKAYFKNNREAVKRTRDYWRWNVCDRYLFESSDVATVAFEE